MQDFPSPRTGKVIPQIWFHSTHMSHTAQYDVSLTHTWRPLLTLSLSLPLLPLTYTLSLLFHFPYFLPLHLDTHLGSSPSRWDTSINSAGSLGSITREGEGAFFPESGYLQQRRSHSGEWVSVLCSVCVLWISVYYPFNSVCLARRDQLLHSAIQYSIWFLFSTCNSLTALQSD